MTIEPSYRIVRIPGVDADEMWEGLLAGGELRPDTRLQAIADAWNSPDDCAAWTTAAKARVRVAHPGVGFLLDALTGETDGE